MFNIAQSFFLDKRGVYGAETVFLTSVDLYFKAKPVQGKTASGIPSPGVEVYICAVDNEIPATEGRSRNRARVAYANIVADTTAATATKFTFDSPIPVITDRSYAILIKFDGGEAGFELWKSKSGETVLGTTQIATTDSAKINGAFFQMTGGMLTPQKDIDLKCKVNVAKFSGTTYDLRFCNRAYEFFSLAPTSITGTFREGEWAFQNTASGAGTISVYGANATFSGNTLILGSGTSFQTTFAVGEKFVFTDGTSGNTDVRTVASITNNTVMSIDLIPSFNNASATYMKTAVAKVNTFDIMNDMMILDNSTAANSTHRFTASSIIKGADTGAVAEIQSIDSVDADRFLFVPGFIVPQGSRVTARVSIANSTYYGNNSVYTMIDWSKKLRFVDYRAQVHSRSTEVANPNLFANTKSVQGLYTFSTTNPYTSPYLDDQNMNMFLYNNIINNDTTAENTPYGNAQSKHITKRITLADQQDAEDLRVFLTAFRPANTDLKVYAKMLNVSDFEQFDEKDWSELELADVQSQSGQVLGSTGLFSNPSNIDDNIVLEYKIPFFQASNTLTGTVTTTLSSNTITGSNTLFDTELVENDLIRVYSTLFPNNHFHAVVGTVSSNTSLTIKTPVSNSSMVASGLQIAKVTNKHQAFINVQGNNIVRYYTSTMAEADTFKQVAVKVVLLSDSGYLAPVVKDIRVLAVTA